MIGVTRARAERRRSRAKHGSVTKNRACPNTSSPHCAIGRPGLERTVFATPSAARSMGVPGVREPLWRMAPDGWCAALGGLQDVHGLTDTANAEKTAERVAGFFGNRSAEGGYHVARRAPPCPSRRMDAPAQRTPLLRPVSRIPVTELSHHEPSAISLARSQEIRQRKPHVSAQRIPGAPPNAKLAVHRILDEVAPWEV